MTATQCLFAMCIGMAVAIDQRLSLHGSVFLRDVNKEKRKLANFLTPQGALANTDTDNDTDIRSNTDAYTKDWGNSLSVYWELRAMALLGGQKYDAGDGGLANDSFLQYLPAQHEILPKFINPEFVQRADNDCHHLGGFYKLYPHECAGAWTHIRSEIQQETQVALDKFFEANGKVEPPPQFESGDAVLHLRLEFNHPQQAWPAKSVFVKNLPVDTKRIRVVHQPYKPEHFAAWKPSSIVGHFKLADSFPVEMERNVDTLLAGYHEMLSDACKGCLVTFETGTQVGDFAKIARAPVVFGTGSTYGLWAALSNVNEVYMSPHFHAGGARPDMGDGFHWFEGNLYQNTDLRGFNGISAEKLVEWIKTN